MLPASKRILRQDRTFGQGGICSQFNSVGIGCQLKQAQAVLKKRAKRQPLMGAIHVPFAGRSNPISERLVVLIAESPGSEKAVFHQVTIVRCDGTSAAESPKAIRHLSIRWRRCVMSEQTSYISYKVPKLHKPARKSVPCNSCNPCNDATHKLCTI